MQFTKALQHTIVWKVLNTLLAFFINLLLVRLMGPEASGHFFYAIAALSFLILVLSCSVESGIIYYGSRNTSNIHSLSIFIIPWLLLLGLLCWLALNIFTLYTSQYLSLIFVISNLTVIYFSALYYSKKWFIALNLCTVFINCIVLTALGFIYYKAAGAAGGNLLTASVYSSAAGIYFGGFGLLAIVLMLVFYIRSGFKETPGATTGLVRKIFAYSFVAFTGNILFFLVTRIDYYFVQQFCDATSLGNYVQVSRVGQLLIMLPSMVAVVLFPYSSGEAKKEYLEKLQSACRMITLLFIPLTVMVVLFGDWILPWLFGAGFNQMYPTMLWYLPGFYALSLVTLLAAYLAGKAMLAANLKAAALALALMITGDWLLIPLYGITGAAAVSSAAYWVCLAYLVTIYRKRMGCRYADFFVIKGEDVKLLLRMVKK